MSTYEESGVNIEAGDQASRSAYEAAKSTFPSRENMIGQPVILEGGFAGLLDFGDFYLVQNDDGVGTKMIIAEQTGLFDTLGYDLLAMVVDDAVCLGAEVTSITNTIDCQKVEPSVIGPLMKGLAKACQEQKIVIPGGEIAELNTMVNGYTWNAAAVGIVAKDRVINGSKITPGDKIIGLPAQGFRSNGFSLIRHILTNEFGSEWYNQTYDNPADPDNSGKTWGEVMLTPCRIFHNDLLTILGRHGQPRQIDIKGLVHITGGGLRGNISRILPDGIGADFNDLIAPLPFMTKLIEIGQVDREEAYKTWNMGMAMALVVAPEDEEQTLQHLEKVGIQAQTVGDTTANSKINF